MATFGLVELLEPNITDDLLQRCLESVAAAIKSPTPTAQRLASSASPPSQRSLNLLKALDKAYKKYDWTTVLRIERELSKTNDGWSPLTVSRCTLAAVILNDRSRGSYAAKAVEASPEQAPLYVALAFVKIRSQVFDDALRLLSVAQVAVNNPKAIWQEANELAHWGINVYTKRYAFIGRAIQEPRCFEFVKELSRPETNWEAVEEAIQASKDGSTSWITEMQKSNGMHSFSASARYYIQPLMEIYWAPTDLPEGSAFAGFTCKIFQNIVKYDTVLLTTLGSTCHAFRSWSSQASTWELLSTYGRPPMQSDVSYRPDILWYARVTAVFQLKKACRLMLESKTREELTASGRDMVANFGLTPYELYEAPFFGVVARLSEILTLDATCDLAHEILDFVPEVIPAFLKHMSDMSDPLISGAAMQSLSVLALRAGPRVLREFDRHGVQALLNGLMYGPEFTDLAAHHAASYGHHYLTQYGALQPLFSANCWITEERAKAHMANHRLDGKWSLVVVPLTHVRSFSSQVGVTDDVFNLFSAAGHMTSNGILATSSAAIRHALLDLTFDGEGIEGEGRFLSDPSDAGEEGESKAKLAPGKALFNLLTADCHIVINEPSSKQSLVLTGKPHPMGFGGTWLMKNISGHYSASQGQRDIQSSGTWCMCKIQEEEGVELPTGPLEPKVAFEAVSPSDAQSYAAKLITPLSAEDKSNMRLMLQDLLALTPMMMQLRSKSFSLDLLSNVTERAVAFSPESRARAAQNLVMPPIGNLEYVEGAQNRLAQFVDACSIVFDMRTFIASKLVQDLQHDIPILRTAPHDSTQLIQVLSKWNRLLCIHTHELLDATFGPTELANFLEAALADAEKNKNQSVLLSKASTVSSAVKNYSAMQVEEVGKEETEEEEKDLLKKAQQQKRRKTSNSLGWVIAACVAAVLTVSALATYAGIQSAKKERKKSL